MDLNRRQRQFLGDFSVLNLGRIIQRSPFHPFGKQRTGSDRRTTTVSLELGVFDDALIVNLDLQAHHVATGRGSHHSRTHTLVFIIKLPDVSGILVVIHHLVAIRHDRSPMIL